MTTGPQMLAGQINPAMAKINAELAAERQILTFLHAMNPPKQYSKRSIALMSPSRGALIAGMGSR